MFATAFGRPAPSSGLATAWWEPERPTPRSSGSSHAVTYSTTRPQCALCGPTSMATKSEPPARESSLLSAPESPRLISCVPVLREPARSSHRTGMPLGCMGCLAVALHDHDHRPLMGPAMRRRPSTPLKTAPRRRRTQNCLRLTASTEASSESSRSCPESSRSMRSDSRRCCFFQLPSRLEPRPVTSRPCGFRLGNLARFAHRFGEPRTVLASSHDLPSCRSPG